MTETEFKALVGLARLASGNQKAAKHAMTLFGVSHLHNEEFLEVARKVMKGDRSDPQVALILDLV